MARRRGARRWRPALLALAATLAAAEVARSRGSAEARQAEDCMATAKRRSAPLRGRWVRGSAADMARVRGYRNMSCPFTRSRMSCEWMGLTKVRRLPPQGTSAPATVESVP